MIDLIIALAIFSIFTGLITTLMFSSLKTNLQTKMAGTATNYTMQILEDIDKISYDEVKNGMENSYKTKFSIPSAFSLKIEVLNYSEGTDKEDLIKKVKVTVGYELDGNTENLVVERLKVKEIP